MLVVVEWPTVEQVQRVKELDDGRVGWHVEWGGSYPGRVIAPATADAEWVAEAVRRFTARKCAGSVAVAQARMWSRVDLVAELE